METEQAGRRPESDGRLARYRRNAGSVIRRLAGGEGQHRPARMGLRLAAFAVFVIAVVAVGLTLDRGSVPWARSLSEGVRATFNLLTEVGQSQWYLVPTGLAVVILQFGDWRRVPQRAAVAWAEIGALAGYVFAAVALSGLLVNVVKLLVGRSRPLFYDQQGWLSLDPLTFGYATASFPSGHATTAGAILVAGVLIFRRWRLAFVALALAICLSRVVVSAHFPSDVVAGFGLGAATAYLLARWLAGRGYAFRLDGPEGRLVPRNDVVRRLWRRPGGAAALVAALRAALA